MRKDSNNTIIIKECLDLTNQIQGRKYEQIDGVVLEY